MSKNSSKNGGISFLGLLQLLFIYLKLTGEIEWEWAWVLSPLWIPLVVIFVVFVAVVCIGVVKGIIKDKSL